MRPNGSPPGLRLRSDTLAEALAVLENRLGKWFDEQGIALDNGERP